MPKNDILWYYDFDKREDLFVNGIKSNLSFSYSPIELCFLLKEINNHEPALVEIIISFMNIRNKIYCWAKFYYNISLSKEDILLIKYVYAVKKNRLFARNIDYSISRINNYLNNQKYSSLFKTIIKDMQTSILYKDTKYKYYTNPQYLIRTIGLFNIMKNNKEVKTIREKYKEIYDKTKDHFYRHQTEPLSHLHISSQNIKICRDIYTQYIKIINKEIKKCYTLGF